MFDDVRAMARDVDVVAIFNANVGARRGDGGDRGRGARRRAAARADLREAARAQPRRSAPGRRARARDRRAHRVLREPDPHEDAPAGARAARRVGGRDGAAHARARGRGARRPAQRVVLGPDPAGRRRALRHGLPQHRGRPLPAHAGRAADRGSSSRGPCRRTSACSSGDSRAGAPSCSNATASTTRARPPKTSRPGSSPTAIPRPRRRRSRSSRSRGCTTSRACGCSSTGSGPATRSRRTACARRSRCSSATRPRASVADAELALEKATASRGLLAIQPNEPDLYGYTDENVDALAAFRDGPVRAARLRRRARRRAPHDGRVPVGRAGPGRRPHRRRDARRARVVRAAHPAGPRRRGAAGREPLARRIDVACGRRVATSVVVVAVDGLGAGDGLAGSSAGSRPPTAGTTPAGSGSAGGSASARGGAG